MYHPEKFVIESQKFENPEKSVNRKKSQKLFEVIPAKNLKITVELLGHFRSKLKVKQSFEVI